MKKILFLGLISCLTQVSALTPKSAKAPSYCEQIVYAHGILLKAQIECGYRKNNNKLISSSTQCVKDQLGEEYGKQVLNSGMKEFDRHVNKDGKESSCKYVLEKFPDYVWK
ncbi:hypothetical protein [Acinetobacter bereziniae]|uniref:hypothetical protein n=1 Tax=Acinetobacter bereziniae TaxID=106648 RepID=UPI0012505887|nr:hypothetical protein [Acinetobacter bereziniae]